jgi:hypothetical protein
VLLDPRISSPAVEYTFKTLLKGFLGIDFVLGENATQIDSPSLYYGYPENCRSPANIKIYCSDFWLDSNYLKKQFLPQPPLPRYRGEELPKITGMNNLPVLFLGRCNTTNTVEKEPVVRVEPKTNSVETNIDVIASSFFMLSRIEELFAEQWDDHGRYPAEDSIAFRERFLQRPIVNEYLELLWSWLSKACPTLHRSRRDFELFLTHDVDYTRRGTVKARLKAMGAQLVKYWSPRGFLEAVKRNLVWLFTRPKDPFKFITQTTKAYGVKSYFFFLADGKSRIYDAHRYDVSSRPVKRIISRLQEEGHRIGLHCSYSSFLDSDQLTAEKRLLEEVAQTGIRGCRAHYLRFRVPDSFALLDKVGFTFDSTLGYDEAIGFRAGTCYPFRPYDVKRDREVGIVEYPLMIMDATVTSPELRVLRTTREITQLIIQQVDRVFFFKGSFVLLVHVDAFEEVDFPWRSVFVQVLRHCQSLRSGSPPIGTSGIAKGD